LFGLPDLYDGTSPYHATFGSFGVMSNSWGVDGSQLYPASLSPWSKEYMGWANVILAAASGSLQLRPYQNSGDVVKITNGWTVLVRVRATSSVQHGPP
jgi:M6 family metalloprotease-like protein